MTHCPSVRTMLGFYQFWTSTVPQKWYWYSPSLVINIDLPVWILVSVDAFEISPLVAVMVFRYSTSVSKVWRQVLPRVRKFKTLRSNETKIYVQHTLALVVWGIDQWGAREPRGQSWRVSRPPPSHRGAEEHLTQNQFYSLSCCTLSSPTQSKLLSCSWSGSSCCGSWRRSQELSWYQ